MGFRQEIEVTVTIDENHLEDAGYHHEDDCKCAGDHVEDLDAFTRPHTDTQDALHDWHEQAHGYTIWSGCRQEPCSILTIDYRKRT